MFHEAKNTIESLYMGVDPIDPISMVKKAAKIGALGGALYAGSNLLASKVAAWAETSTSQICEQAKTTYKFFVGDVNDFAHDYIKDHTLEELGRNIGTLKGKGFEELNWAASYLKDTCNQNPDSIAKLDQIIYKALEIYNLKPQDIPFFGSPEADLIILLGSIFGGTIAAWRFLGRKYKDLFYNSSK